MHRTIIPDSKGGEKVAEKLGNAKEEFDYYYNQVWKGFSPLEASKDRLHDRKVNEIGRQRAKSGVYTNSKVVHLE